jgi:predicted phage-related endonuclease
MVGKVTPNDMLSASRLPAVCGMSQYRSPNDELLSSIAAIDGKELENISNESMDWGNKLEPTILTEAAHRLGCHQLDINHEKPYFHDKWPISCSLDGTATGSMEEVFTDPDRGIYVVGQSSIRLEGTGVLEAKLTAMDAEDVLPLYRGPIQLQAQMAITKASWGAIAVLYRGTELRVFLFGPHPETLELIERTCKEFQDKLDRYKNTGYIDHYPPISPKDAARTWSTGSDSELVKLDDYGVELTKLILENKQKISRLEEETAKAQTEIMGMMRDHSHALAGDFQITWPQRSYKAAPAKIVPAKEAYTIRQSTLNIKALK